MTNQQKVTVNVLRTLWSNWALSFGAVTLVLVFSLFVSKIWLPLIVFFEAYVLMWYVKTKSVSGRPSCLLLVRAAMQVLFWSAVIMAFINLLSVDWLFGSMDLSASNKEIPYISSLVIFPVTISVALWNLIRVGRCRWCRMCRASNGFFPGDSFVATLYDRETRYQLTMLLMMTVAVSAVQWWYYFTYYINVNLNSPDRFFFHFMPMAVYVLSLCFVYARYLNLYAVYGAVGELDGVRSSASSEVRVLVISGDEMLLRERQDGRWDTPVAIPVANDAVFCLDQVRAEVEEREGVKDFDIRYIYTSSGYEPGSRHMHYAAFVSAEARPALASNEKWMTLDEISRLMRTARLSVDLMGEISRIHTITMAWKTYDREGRRLYPIKHYVPTFRLRDFKDWDVDYNDTSWYQVAANNEDRPFFRVRRLWHRLTRHLNR